jgi:hypothetical protein
MDTPGLDLDDGWLKDAVSATARSLSCSISGLRLRALAVVLSRLLMEAAADREAEHYGGVVGKTAAGLMRQLSPLVGRCGGPAAP